MRVLKTVRESMLMIQNVQKELLNESEDRAARGHSKSSTTWRWLVGGLEADLAVERNDSPIHTLP